MAISEGLKSFVDFFKNSFTEPIEEDPDTVFGGFGSGYDVVDNVALQPQNDDLDNIYPKSYSTNVTTKPSFKERFTGRNDSKVTTLPSTPYKSAEMIIIEPRSFSESAQIVKNLIDKKTVVLHLDLLDKEQSQRTIDFVCGASHALNGTVERVSDGVVIFAPENIALTCKSSAIQNKFSELNWKPM